MQSQFNILPEQLATTIYFELSHYQKNNILDAITVKNSLKSVIPFDYDVDSVNEVLKIVKDKLNYPQPIRNPNFFIGYATKNGEEISTTLNAIDGGIVCYLNPFSDEARQILSRDVIAKLFETKNVKISKDRNEVLNIVELLLSEAIKSSDSYKNTNIVPLLEIQLAILNGKFLTSEQLSLLEPELSLNYCNI